MGYNFRHIKYIVILVKEGSTKHVNIMTPGVGVLLLDMAIYVKMHYFPKNLPLNIDQTN